MPVLNITTNAELTDSQNDLKTLSAEVAKMLGKPEQYVLINLLENPDMLFAGSEQPLAYLELKSIGLPEDRTSEFSATLCKLIGQLFYVKKDRIYIEFSDAKRHMFGWNGRTFAG